MTTVSSLVDYSMAFNGYVFGGADKPVQVTSIEGLEDLPVIRNQDDNRGYQDGMFTGSDFLSGRTIVVSFQVLAGEGKTMMENLSEFQSALQPQRQGTKPLQFKMPGFGIQRVDARVRRRSIKIDPNFTYGKAVGTYEFFCPDPLIYSDNLQQLDIFSLNQVTGRTYNRVYNMLYGDGNQVATLIHNEGWTNTYPVITITGPCLNPLVINQTTGAFLLVNYNLQTSDTLVLDTNLKSVTLNGVNRRSLLTNNSTWFSIPAGYTNLKFAPASGSSAGTSCVVSWRSAYL